MAYTFKRSDWIAIKNSLNDDIVLLQQLRLSQNTMLFLALESS